jgi:uncharacterized protein (TIGR00725 family)
MKKLIAVFGPGDVDESEPIYREALALGRALAENRFVTLTGGYDGIMEAASRGAHEAGGTVIGVTADVYFARGREANAYVTREVRVKSANDRLMELMDLADAYVAIGNSTGTLNEVMTAWDYTIKHFLPEKPLLLVGDVWKAFMDYVTSDPHFLQAELLTHAVDSSAVIARLIDVFGVQSNLPDLTVVKQ